jgi:VCBS repeat-containing protein
MNADIQYFKYKMFCRIDYFKIYAKDGTPMDITIRITLKGVDDDAENNAPVVIEIEHDENKICR